LLGIWLVEQLLGFSGPLAQGAFALLHSHHNLKFAPERDAIILGFCRGSNVLHIGAADSPYSLEKLRQGLLLQTKIGEVAMRLIGIDSDQEAVELLQATGVQNLMVGDVDSTPALPFIPNVVVFGETIEHLTNIGTALESLKRLMNSHTRLLISTPNVLSLYVFCKRETQHDDHRVGFTYGLLLQVLNSYGLEVEDFYFTFLNRATDDFKRFIWRSVSRYLIGLSETLLAVCKLKE
jgi:2-polyprenyl-3-methyl-5-hydroxy-6-metoxy-1,4-benzoquinol methylase